MTTRDTALEHAWSWDTVDRQVRDRVAENVFHATDKLDVAMLGNLDQVSLVPSLTRLSAFWALHPAKVFERTTKYYQQSLRAWNGLRGPIGRRCRRWAGRTRA